MGDSLSYLDNLLVEVVLKITDNGAAVKKKDILYT